MPAINAVVFGNASIIPYPDKFVGVFEIVIQVWVCVANAAPIDEGVIVAVLTLVNCPCSLYVITGIIDEEPILVPEVIILAIDIVLSEDKSPPPVNPVPAVIVLLVFTASVIPNNDNVDGLLVIEFHVGAIVIFDTSVNCPLSLNVIIGIVVALPTAVPNPVTPVVAIDIVLSIDKSPPPVNPPDVEIVRDAGIILPILSST